MRNIMKKYLKIAAIALFAVVLTGAVVIATSESVAASGCETAVLPQEWCNNSADPDDNGIFKMIRFVLNLLGGGISIVGVIGIVICGVMYLTARDNEAQVAKAKKRLIDVVIGVAIWFVFAFGANGIMNLLMPNPTDIPMSSYNDITEIA